MATRASLVSNFLDEVWSAGKVEACVRYLASEYKIHHDPGDPWEGQSLDLEAFENRVRVSRTPFPDQRFLVQKMLSDVDCVAVTWLWEATHQADIPGFPATGLRLRISGATLYFLNRADRICGHWQITDRLSVFQQLQAAKG